MNIQTVQEQAKNVVDATLGGGAVASPWWLVYFNDAANALMIVGGIALLAIRLAISWREWRRGKNSVSDS